MPSTPTATDPFLRALRAVLPHANGEVIVTAYAVAASDRHTAATALYAPWQPLSWTISLSRDTAVRITKEWPIGAIQGLTDGLHIGDAVYPIHGTRELDGFKRILSYIPPLTMSPVSLIPLENELLTRFSSKALGAGTLRLIPTGGTYYPPGSVRGGVAGQYRAQAVRVEFEDWFSGAIMPTQELG